MKKRNILYAGLIILILFIVSACSRQSDKDVSQNMSSSEKYSASAEDNSGQKVTLDEKVSVSIEDRSAGYSSENIGSNSAVSSNENNPADSFADNSDSTRPYNSSAAGSENNAAKPGNSSGGASANAGGSGLGSSAATNNPSGGASIKPGNSTSGNTSKPTQAAKPVQPATSAPKPTQAAKPVQPETKAPVWHEPVYKTVPVYIVDKEAWTEEVKTEKQVPVYKSVDYIICVCGFETTDLNVSKEHGYNHIRNDEPEATRVETRCEIIGYETQYEITYIDHPQEGHWGETQILVSEGYWE